MEELSTIKRELKCWESMFERKHGRRPNKDDIKSSSDEIRDAYVKYKHLKEAKEKVDDEDSGVFGKELNKKFDTEHQLVPVRLKGWENIKPVHLCHGQRPKSKSSSQSTKLHVESNVENMSNNHAQESAIDEVGLTSVTIKTPRMTPMKNILRKNPGTVDMRLKRRASLFAASLRKIEGHSGKDNSEVTTSNAKEITASHENGDFECKDNDSCESQNFEKDDKVGSHENLDAKFSQSRSLREVNAVQNRQGFEIDRKLSPVLKNSSEEKHDMNSFVNKINKNLAQATEGLFNEKLCSPANVPPIDKKTSGNFESNTEKPSRNIKRKTKDLIEKVKLNGCSISGHLGNDEEPICRKRKSTGVEVPDTKRARTEETEEHGNFVDETGSASDEEPEETFEEVKIKSSSSKSRSSSSSLVSDNFVRLDMKHKSYRRRGHGMTGSAYKRKTYNNIMKARGEYVSKSSWSRRSAGGRGMGSRSRGVSNTVKGSCYKCGQEGHWAKNCKGKMMARREIPEDDDDEREEFTPEDDDFIQELTLEKAALMAAGVAAEEDADSNSLVVLPHQLPRPAYVPPAPPDAIEPLFKTVDGKIIETPKEVYTALGHLGYSAFRSGQEEAIMRILSGVSSLVVLSTGAGKSLCYQLPAYMYYKRSPSISLVISPLVSLMEDQIGGLPFGLKGACLHTNQTKSQRDKIIENIVSGKIAVLLLSPEALVGSGSGGGCLPSGTRLPPIAFACIDEAHCLSEWSHNFRPSYLRVCKVLRERFGVRCFLGLTATATSATAASVAQHLGICNDEGAVIRGAAVPPNLYLSVSRDRDRDKALIELLQGPRFSTCESIIIYCTRREVTERVATLVRTCLQHMAPSLSIVDEDQEAENTKKKSKKSARKMTTKGSLTWEAESYHAGMSPAQRRRVQKRFMSGELRIVVATVAFGMGLDKSDVRAIIHYNMPKSFESYVQEIGRAGRDGLPSHCHVFLDREGKDMCELKRHVHANTVDRVVVKKLVNKLFLRCKCKTLYESQQKRKRQHESKLDHVEKMDDQHVEYVTDEVMSQLCEEEINNIEKDIIEQTIDVVGDNENGKTEPLIIQESDEINEIDGQNDEKELTISSSIETQEETNRTNSSDPSEKVVTLKEKVTYNCEKEQEIVNHQDFGEENSVCGGHDVAIVIESAVQELDMPEESIATLLCYLELHQNRWLEVLQPLKASCTVKFYGGHDHLRAVAKRIPPIAAAVVYCDKKEKRFKKKNSISFPVVEIADKMGWDLEPVYKELRALQWNSSLASNSKMSSSGQSGILVEFTDNAMHVRTPGDLDDEERDEVCDFIYDRIQAEERTQLKQLTHLYSSLLNVSCNEYWQCSEEVDKESDQELKILIKAYFDNKNNATQIELETLKKERKHSHAFAPADARDEHVNWDCISRDIRALTNVHHDQSFTGRAVARIFHGISSPCYPAEVWGRDRRFWRKYLDVDFNSLRRYATSDLLKLR